MDINYSEIARHFCIAAVWADCEEGTRPRVTATALENAERYARAFISENYSLSVAALQAPGYGSHPDAGSQAAAFGHDLWLTARGHGAGFWDRDELRALDVGNLENVNVGQGLADALADWKTWEVEGEFYGGCFYFAHKKASDKFAPVRVVFRLWNSGHGKGDVIALFPDIKERGYMCESYMHIGQHGAADYSAVIERTRPATPEEYAYLERELTAPPFFYRLNVIKRANPRKGKN